ncbi:MAG: hypothetical protein U9Q82_11170 [Chloroflexota bacterium]|nr:hypothetical protein [Chloroflexota bacterium]
MAETVTIKIRLYPDRDGDLLDWLDTVSNEYGAKSLAVKTALRRGVENHHSKADQPPDISIDAETLLESLLPPLRRLVENAVRSELANIDLARNDVETENEGDDIGAVLDAMEGFM